MLNPNSKHVGSMDKILHDLVYLNYGIYGTRLYLGHAEFCPSTVGLHAMDEHPGNPTNQTRGHKYSNGFEAIVRRALNHRTLNPKF